MPYWIQGTATSYQTYTVGTGWAANVGYRVPPDDDLITQKPTDYAKARAEIQMWKLFPNTNRTVLGNFLSRVEVMLKDKGRRRAMEYTSAYLGKTGMPIYDLLIDRTAPENTWI